MSDIDPADPAADLPVVLHEDPFEKFRYLPAMVPVSAMVALHPTDCQPFDGPTGGVAGVGGGDSD